jgi:hypothetical protein
MELWQKYGDGGLFGGLGLTQLHMAKQALYHHVSNPFCSGYALETGILQPFAQAGLKP